MYGESNNVKKRDRIPWKSIWKFIIILIAIALFAFGKLGLNSKLEKSVINPNKENPSFDTSKLPIKSGFNNLHGIDSRLTDPIPMPDPPKAKEINTGNKPSIHQPIQIPSFGSK